MTSAAALTTDIVGTEAEFAALEDQWLDLWRRCPAATPFQSPAWALPWWRHFAPGALHAAAVWREGRLAALAPLYVERTGHGARLLPVGISLSDYLDILIDPDCPEAAGRIAEALERSGLRCDCEELRPEASAWALPCPEGFSEEVHWQSACPVLELGGGADLSACVPARRRRQLRRAEAAAERRGPVAVEAAGEDPARFLEDLFRLHGARWDERGESGVLADETVRAFHRDALPRLLASGLARCFRMRIGGRVAGAYYGLAERGRAYAYLGGFDPAFSAESPGAVLIGHAIREAIGEGATEFHFLRGREAYKYSWGARDRLNRRRTFVPPAA